MEDLSVSLPELTSAGKLFLIEGTRILPAGVAKLVSEPRRAVWLAPSRAAIGERLVPQWNRLIERFVDPVEGHSQINDIFYAVSERIAQAAEDLNLGVVRTEATDSVEDVATRVAQKYGL